MVRFVDFIGLSFPLLLKRARQRRWSSAEPLAYHDYQTELEAITTDESRARTRDRIERAKNRGEEE